MTMTKRDDRSILDRLDDFVTANLFKIIGALLGAGLVLNVCLGFSIFY